jgi:tight adherence protein C
MVLVISGATFFACVLIIAALYYAFSPSETVVAERVARVLDSSIPAREKEEPIEKGPGWMREAIASMGKMLPAARGQALTRWQLMAIRAGYRRPDSVLAIRGMKVLMPVLMIALVLFTGIYSFSPFIVLLLAAFLGYLIPEIWVNWRIKARQHRLRLSLPDALDLLVICVEVGLGLDQALMRVATELQIVHPELSEELQLVTAEMRVGKTRIDALRELGRRTGLDDIKSLVGMLIQTERFGTSIAQSLRIYSEDLRTKRRQRAEELSAKTAVKMVPALVFFIFPALLAVILGPALITLMRTIGAR